MLPTQTLTIEKLVHGGQAIGTLTDGRRAFVWNALPGETVNLRVTKSKSSHIEGVAEEILKPSPDRQVPRDEAYLSTSPWQITTFESENTYKQEILTETMRREHVDYSGDIPMVAGQQEWHYRNKMEYSFWADDNGLHLALFNRGTHGKIIVPGSSIALSAVDTTANQIVAVLNKHGIRGSQLKTVVVRSNQAGQTVAALFVKDESFPKLEELEATAQGVVVCYSNPKSPASVLTRELYNYGDTSLGDTIGDKLIHYDVHSFFQVNVEIFNQALGAIKRAVGEAAYIDMYSGVGTIGLGIGGAGLLIESDVHNCAMARQNSDSTNIQIIEAPAEQALEYIDGEHVLVVDPPRAGLHGKVTDRILEVLPPKLIYLSCNPITQARDLALLQGKYNIASITGYNFFPKTPHIESLAILELR